MALAAGGVLIAPQLILSCKNEKLLIAGEYTLEPFSSLEEMRNAARLCKGHLTHEMNRVIASKNAEQIFTFVNSKFATIPSSGTSITNAAYNVRWGMRGLLRCGKGTLREKSDLLFYMLTQAGFKPQYFRQNFELNPKLLNDAFCTVKDDNDEFVAPGNYKEKWSKAFATYGVEDVSVDIENSDERSKKLAKQIAVFLPEDAHEQLDHFNWLDVDGVEIPIIRIKTGNSVKDVNLFEAKTFSEFSETQNTNSLFELDDKTPNKNIGKVRVILKATYSNNINTPLELVRGEWDLETLIGRQVALQFVPPVSTKQQLLSTIHQINQFVPFLTLRDPDMNSEERKKHTFSGTGFDMFGNTFVKDGDGAIKMNGFKMNDVIQHDTSIIKTLKAKLIDNEYPNITLKLAPLNSDEKLVLGLGGNAFSITDQEEQQLAVVSQNHTIPEILVFFDNTASMPYPYAYNEFPEDTKRMITLALEKEFYAVNINIASFGVDFIEDLNRVSVDKYDYVLCFGDGESFENLSSNLLKEIVKTTPISYHYIENGYHNQTSIHVKKYFKESGFLFFQFKNLENDIHVIASSIQKNGIYPYTLTYNAPFENDNLIHKVEVCITNNNMVKPVKLQYVIDRERAYKTTAFPCGLSLEIQWESGYETKSIQQHLVGFDIRKDDSKPEFLEVFKTDLKDYLLGVHLLCFEADKPTFPVLLDDLLTASLTQVPLALSNDKSLDEVIKNLEATQPLPAESISAFCGVQDAVSRDRITFENQFQTCLYSEYYDTNKQSSVLKIDMLPTSDIRTFASTKKEAYYKTLEQTAILALSEANLFKTSTYSDLKNKSLKRFTVTEQKHPLYPILKYYKDYYYHIIYDNALTTQSYWQINKSTGALLGMLPDGSGGGSIVEKQRLEMALKIWETWTNLVVKVTKGGITMGIVALYGMFLAELYGVVALEVNSLGAGTDFEKDLKDLLKKYAKKGYKKVKGGFKK